MASSGSVSLAGVATALQTLTLDETKELFLFLNVPLHSIKNVSIHHSVNICKIEYIQLWIDHNLDASWERIVTGLEQIGKKALANKLALQYCGRSLSTTDKPSSLSPSPLPSTSPAALPKRELSLRPSTPPPPPPPPPPTSLPPDRVAQVMAEIDKLSEEFTILMSKTRDELCVKEKSDSSFVDFFRDRLLDLPLAKKVPHNRFFYKNEDDLLMAENIKKIFAILRRYCSYFNYDILREVIRKFCKALLQQRMREYITTLEIFEKATTIDVYLAAGSAGPVLTKEFIKMTITVNKPPNECTLHEVRKLKEEIAEKAYLHLYSTYLDNISASSVKVELGIHVQCVGKILAVLTLQFLSTHLLSNVMLDGKSLVTMDNVPQKELNEELISASKRGDIMRVISVLNSGADIQTVNEYSETALHLASEEGHLQIVHLLIVRGSVVDSRDKGGWTPLITAAFNGHYQIAILLLSLGADVNVQDNNGDSALILAAWNGHSDSVMELVKAGANLDLQDSEAERVADQIREAGNQSMKRGNFYDALWKYNHALVLCRDHKLPPERVSVVSSNCAQACLNLKYYFDAFSHTNDAIATDPHSPILDKAYYVRAESLRKMLESPERSSEVPEGKTYSDVVEDYIQCHRNVDSIDAIIQAVLIAATKKELSSKLKKTKKKPLMNGEHVENGFTTKLLVSLLERDEVKEAHVKVLLEIPIQPAKPPLYDGSKIPVSTLLRKKITNSKILSTLFDCGMVAKERDVKMAVETLSDDNETTTMICSHVDSNTDLDGVCQFAFERKKIRFVLCLVSNGSKLPCTSQVILEQAIQRNLIKVAESFLPFCTLREVDLGQLMATCKQLVNHQPLIVKMIDGGVNPSGLGDRKPLAEVTKMSNINRKVDLISVLLEKGCDPTQLCAASKGSTTPIHVAVSIGVEARGSTRVLDAVVSSSKFSVEAYRPYIDENGKTPTDLAVAGSRGERSLKLIQAVQEILKCAPVPVSHGKRATDKTTDKTRIKASKGESEQKTVSVNVKGEKERKKNSSGGEAKAKEADQQLHNNEKRSIKSLSGTLDNLLRALSSRENDYFVKQNYREDNGEGTNENRTQEVLPVRNSLSPEPVLLERQESGDINTVMSQYGLEDFDGLPWEVEVTNSVLKFFKNSKEHPYTLRLQAAKTVHQLAEGKRSMDLSKKLNIESKKPKKRESPDLFEARINEEARIIWQVAIQFSPRRTGEYQNPIYAQVIRIWEIVPDHSKLTKAIKDTVVRQIELSNEKGLSASLNVPLLPYGEQKQSKKSVRQQERLEVPVIYTQTDVVGLSSSDIEHFTPAASPKEDEFNMTTFYSFSGALLKSMLTGNLARRDFPFKEWPKEHEIINLPDTESILLLGRSGTGKTTCCLYRLWNELKLYWDRANIIKLPRQPLVRLSVAKEKEDEEEGEEEEEDEEEGEEDTEEEKNALDEKEENDIEEKEMQDHKTNSRKYRNQPLDSVISKLTESSRKESEPPDTTSKGVWGVKSVKEVNEHLHQVFVTKNYVLCAQMKRRFYDMAASHDFLNQHMEWETKNLPHSFAEIDDLAYPLFLTARQFYILLDNSISSDHECFFRPREKDGSLRIKIVSSDYDHEDPDTLLDLEDSDNEGDDLPTAGDHTTPFATNQQQKYVEVTALYFSEKIWPEISHKCNARHLDPLLVWMEIQSFIKGSRIALLRGSALPLEEYRQIGNKMAPNFSSERVTIYKLYQCYERHCLKKRHSVFLFDECDLVHDIHRRLRQVQDLPWSIHTLYIDEVQDFTQAELALYLHCCRHPNSLFFTGDTAQSIMRGIAFRFQDLRSSFHAIHEVVPQVNVPQQPHTLTINFRSHAGILKLAGSIIDLLQMFFKGSIDYLPADEGMFPGPTPVVLASCEESDLALLLSSNMRESSRIEFGAHQVVLVQSKEAKERLPSILKGAIVLTIFESKGLEFDDVLLYNFFNDSMVDKKGWRVVTAYLEEHTDSVKVKKRLPSSSSEPRSNKFDEKQHKSLNSELKYLYTAITRAKCNLWIYDCNTKKRLPMFDLWYKRGLVEVSCNTITEYGKHSLFTKGSTPQQWKMQGDRFMRQSRWEQAKHCYDRAGYEGVHLSYEANARFTLEEANSHQSNPIKPQLFLEAAVDFLHRDQIVHSVQCILLAAHCLRRAQSHRVGSAAVLYERLRKYDEAMKCYRKINDIDNCVRLLEREERYDVAVEIIPTLKNALAKSIEYTKKKGIQLCKRNNPETLSCDYAHQCAKRKESVTLFKVLGNGYIRNCSKRAKYLKICGLYNEALEESVNGGELDDAYRLASGQCMFSEGREIAKEYKDPKKEAEFVFHQVHSELLKRSDKNRLFPAELERDLHKFKIVTDPMINAHANLLLGIVTENAGLCQVAHWAFDDQNEAAALEAFHAFTFLAKRAERLSVPQVLTMCSRARKLQDALSNDDGTERNVRRARAFYGLEKGENDVDLTPQNHNVWVSAKLRTRVKKSKKEKIEKKDDDGYLKLDATDTRKVLAGHVGSFAKAWLSVYDIESTIEKSLTSFILHAHLRRRALIQFHTQKEIPPRSLTSYMENLMNLCWLGDVLRNEEKCRTAISTLLSLFSPQVSMQIPLDALSHVTLVRHATCYVHDRIRNKINANLNPSNVNCMDTLLAAWRACCLCNGTKILQRKLVSWEKVVNKGDDSNKHHAYMKDEKGCYHVFWHWLQSCTPLKEKRPIWAAKQAIYHFLGTISQRKSLSISIMNLVNVLIVHSMSVFAMLTLLRGAKFFMPLNYSAVVELYNVLNYDAKEHGTLFSACTDEVRNHRGDEEKLERDCYNLLDGALEILLGNYKKDPKEEQRNFDDLKSALDERSGASQHYLVLALIIFVNMYQSPTQSYEATKNKIVSFFNKVAGLPNVHKICKKGKKVLQSPKSTIHSNILSYVGELLATVSKGAPPAIVLMVVNERRIDFMPLSASAQAQWSLPSQAPPNEECTPNIQAYQQNIQSPYDPLASSVATEPIHTGSFASNAGIHPHIEQLSRNPTCPPQHNDSASLPLTMHKNAVASSLLQEASQPPIMPSIKPSIGRPSLEQSTPSSNISESSSPLLENAFKDPSPKVRSAASNLFDSPVERSTAKRKELYEDKHFLPGPVEVEEHEDERIPWMLTSQGTQHSQLPPVDPHLIDPNIVTEELCSICGVDFLSKHETDETGETEEAIREEYELHVRSENHSQNYTLHKNFKEKFEESYSVMVKELSSLIRKCERVQVPSLTQMTYGIRRVQEKYDKEVTEMEDSLNWRKGLALIDEAVEKFQTLLTRGDKELKRIRSGNSHAAAKREKNDGEDGDAEFHAEMKKPVHDVPGFDDFKVKLRSETAKMESRSRKKYKKKKNIKS